MITVPSLSEKTVAVMGLGIAGLSAARALTASGTRVMAWDDNPEGRARAAEAGVNIADPAGADWREIALLVLSPGIPHTFPAPHPVAAMAEAAGVPIVCDVDLLGRAYPSARYLGITGTNGKSTTTALVGHILSAAGTDTRIGGNLGPAVLDFDPPAGPDTVFVLELSSYQLERIGTIRHSISVLLNISPDHLDRHGGMDGYIAAKKHIFDRQTAGDKAIVGIDDPHCRAIADALAADAAGPSVIRITQREPADGEIGITDGRLLDRRDGKETVIADLRAIATLPGAHNAQNAAAAYAACHALGLSADVIAAGLASFPGLPHRQERVGVINRVSYVNDSKATNADAAARALSSYERIYWIAGGRPKDGGYAELDPYLDRIIHGYLIGEGAPGIARYLTGHDVPHTLSGTLDRAVAEAHDAAQADAGKPDPVVLLSPACASFDQFDNFGARGDRFRKLVHGLAGSGDFSGERA